MDRLNFFIGTFSLELFTLLPLNTVYYRITVIYCAFYKVFKLPRFQLCKKRQLPFYSLLTELVRRN